MIARLLLLLAAAPAVQTPLAGPAPAPATDAAPKSLTPLVAGVALSVLYLVRRRSLLHASQNDACPPAE